MGSLLILIYTVLKHYPVFIINFGLSTLVIFAALCFFRLILPFEFPKYQYIIGISMGNAYTYKLLLFRRISKVIIIIAIIGCTIYLFQMLIQQLLFYRYLNTCSIKNNPIAVKLLSEIDATQSVCLKQISGISVPMIIGLTKPTIYLPDINYTHHELKYIILHEYTHWKNKDLVVKYFVRLMIALFWWNPIVHLLLKNLDQTLELKCDYVVSHSLTDNEKIVYLETLLYSLKSAQNYTIPKKAVLSSELINISNESFIKQRFYFILYDYPSSSIQLLLRTTFLVASVLFMLVSYSIIIQPQFDTPPSEIWNGNVDATYDSKNTYIERSPDGTYFLHIDAETTIKIPKEDIYNGFYDDYLIRSSK